jgi:hypothetical protein
MRKMQLFKIIILAVSVTGILQALTNASAVSDRLEFLKPWDEGIITDGYLEYNIQSNNSVFQKMVLRAIAEWNEALKGKINIIEHDKYDKNGADIEFHFTKNPNSIEPTANADEDYAYTASDHNKEGDTIKSKVVVNAEYVLIPGFPNDDIEVLLPIIKREIGHALGLDSMTTPKYLMNEERLPNRLHKVSNCEADAVILLNCENRQATGGYCNS